MLTKKRVLKKIRGRRKGKRWGKDFRPPVGLPLHSTPSPSDIIRFLSHVKVDPCSGCWLWGAAISKRKGYGQFKFAGKMVWAHRFSVQVLKGVLQMGQQAGHKHDICSNPHCVNPAHLQAEDVSDNAADANYRRYGTTPPPPPANDIPF
jgi:hypothetical protein